MFHVCSCLGSFLVHVKLNLHVKQHDDVVNVHIIYVYIIVELVSNIIYVAIRTITCCCRQLGILNFL